MTAPIALPKRASLVSKIRKSLVTIETLVSGILSHTVLHGTAATVALVVVLALNSVGVFALKNVPWDA